MAPAQPQLKEPTPPQQAQVEEAQGKDKSDDELAELELYDSDLAICQRAMVALHENIDNISDLLDYIQKAWERGQGAGKVSPFPLLKERKQYIEPEESGPIKDE